MSSVKVKAALETALNAMSPALLTAWENAQFQPVAGTPYQQVNVLFAPPENVEYGRRYREVGYMRVMLMYPLGNGLADAMARAELIRASFYRGASFVKDTVTVIIERTPEISTGSVDGDRWAIPVKIRFFANVD